MSNKEASRGSVSAATKLDMIVVGAGFGGMYDV